MSCSLLVRADKGLGAAREGTETPAPLDRAHPGCSMSFGKGERAAQPVVRPVPRQNQQPPTPTRLCCAPSPALGPQLCRVLSSSVLRDKDQPCLCLGALSALALLCTAWSRVPSERQGRPSAKERRETSCPLPEGPSPRHREDARAGRRGCFLLLGNECICPTPQP